MCCRPAEILALCALLAGVPAFAQDGRGETRDRLRPTGPVTVTADRAEWEKGGVMVYSGKVVLTSDTLKLNGDRIELRQLADGQYEAHITGTPAQLDHAGIENGGEDGQPVTAVANTLDYDSRSSIVEIKDHARLTRGENSITGDLIRYDVAARRIRASGGDGGQVRIVIQPPPEKKDADGPGARKGAAP